MAPKRRKLPVIAEKSYLKSVWCNEILNGIGKSNYDIISFEDAQSFPKNSVIVILGTSNHFFEKAISLCKNNNLRPLLVGTEISDADSRISSIKTNRKAAMNALVHYCKYHGRSKIALFGISRHSSIDLEKRAAFTEAAISAGIPDVSKNIHYNSGNLKECIDGIFEKISSYDSVICSNDYFATAFITEAVKRGIKVPEDIYVTGYGNSFIGEKISPSITTVAPRYKEMGIHTEKIYSHLAGNPDITSLELLLGYDIIVRESTANMKLCKNLIPRDTISETAFNSMFDDEYMNPVLTLDAIIGSSDKSLFKIIDAIARGESYSSIAERLYLSDSAFRYKLNKIFNITNTSSKNELKQLRNSINLKDDEK